MSGIRLSALLGGMVVVASLSAQLKTPVTESPLPTSTSRSSSTTPEQIVDFHKLYPFSGVSGPGLPVEAGFGGGWRSGSEGVTYQGNHPKPYFKVVASGLTSPGRRAFAPEIMSVYSWTIR
jgi:hypothetical protein